MSKIQKEGKGYKKQAEKLSEELAVLLSDTLIAQESKVSTQDNDGKIPHSSRLSLLSNIPVCCSSWVHCTNGVGII